VKGYDAIVVGARCAGAPLAMQLARSGADVLVIDRAEFPSDTVSTHFLYPNSLATLERLGVLERLLARHDLPAVGSRIRLLGHEIIGGYTAIEGHSGGMCPRRLVLDAIMLETAADAGVTARLGERVAGVLGAGTDDEPVRGVRLQSGEEIAARWVFGADGRASTIARSLGLEKSRSERGDFASMYAYWKGLPDTEYGHLDVHGERALNWVCCEDGIQLLVANRESSFTRGTPAERERRYLAELREFPDTFDPDWLDSAERISEVRVAPETMLRGYYRQAAGPGWALVGDAGHFKHPVTAQGISDAIEQACFVADAVVADRGLDGYETWRDERAEEHYEWSFQWARFPNPELVHPIFGGIENDPAAGQDLRDSFSRLVSPADVMSRERLARWFGQSEVASAG
jgi:2-polyprenyl-6-methoxyphenol hydroxylase-like FAD-dependent oxidoreductase